MGRRNPLGRTTLISFALVAATAALSVAGPASVFSLARRNERTRNSIDAVGVVERDVALAHARHRSYLIDQVPARLEAYRRHVRLRDAHLDSLQITTVIDTQLAARLAELRVRLRALDAVRDSIIELRDSSLTQVRQAISTDAARSTSASVDRTLLELEGLFRSRLASAQPQLERRRTLVLTIIPGMLAAVLILLIWLYRRLLSAAERDAASAARYRELLDGNPDGVIVQAGGRIVYVNAQAVELCGADSAGQLIGSAFLDLIDPADREIVLARTADVMGRNLRPPPRLIHLTRRDGKTIEVETRGARIDYEGVQAAEVTLRDVAERRQRELALASSEQRFRAVLEAMQEGVVLQDEAMHIVLWNSAAERILGLSADQMAGKTSYDPAWRATDEYGDALPGDRHFGAVALRTARPAAGIMGLDRGDGLRIWLRVSAVPILRPDESRAFAVVATFTDITEQRETARRLSESEARYRLITEYSGDLITMRGADDTLLYVSPSHSRIIGWTPEELVGRPGATLVHPDDRPRLTGGAGALFSGQASRSITLRLKHKDGRWVWIEVVASPITIGNEAFSTFVTSARDITERLQLEEELRQSQKMESLGRVSSAVAHDFNNLLTAIRGSAELLRLAPAAAEIEEGVTEITSAVDRAAGLTGQLLAFARRQHIQPTLLNCAVVLQESSALLARLAAPDVTVTCRIGADPEAMNVWADRSQFEQVIFNLVVNARDASAPGSHVEVRLECTERSGDVTDRFGTLAAGAYVALSVADEGSGIPDDVLAQMFEPFYTTKSQGKGTGLGLSTVYGLVRQHGGGVTVDSEEGRGSRFTIYWPRRDAADFPAVAVTKPSIPHPIVIAPAPMARGTRPQLLLVDDEEAVRRTVAKLLTKSGFTVIEAASGDEAIALLRARTTPIDAVITDVRMPGMSGVDLAERMFQERFDIPVLFISGQLDDPIPTEWPSGAVRAFLRKPFRGSELTSEAWRLVEKAT